MTFTSAIFSRNTSGGSSWSKNSLNWTHFEISTVKCVPALRCAPPLFCVDPVRRLAFCLVLDPRETILRAHLAVAGQFASVLFRRRINVTVTRTRMPLALTGLARHRAYGLSADPDVHALIWNREIFASAARESRRATRNATWTPGGWRDRRCLKVLKLSVKQTNLATESDIRIVIVPKRCWETYHTCYIFSRLRSVVSGLMVPYF